MASRTGRNPVKQSVADIEHFYKIGRESLDKHERLPHGAGRTLAEKKGMSLDLFQKSRQFAQQFGKSDLTRLCKTIEKGGVPLSVQHIVRLLWVEGKQQRQRFLKQTIEKGWSCRELGAAIQKVTGSRPTTGRTPRVRDQSDAVQRLLQICEQWQRLRTAIEKAAINGRLPQNRLQTCDEALRKLYGRLRSTPKPFTKP